jgi:hypothetical protein
MMRAEYDSQANALSIDLVEADRWDDVPDEPVHDDYCHVAFASGRPANVELLYPRDHLDLLDRVAAQFELDAEKLKAAATAALAAPDRVVTLEVATRASA